MNKNIECIICCWEYQAPPENSCLGKRWVLRNCYGIDDDGYRVTPSMTDADCYRPPEREWMDWVRKKDEDDWDSEPIMGRAVTIWSWNGVRLLEFNPPEWVNWLSTMFWEKLKERNDWATLLEHGWQMSMGTAYIAQKVAENDWKFPIDEKILDGYFPY